MIAQTPPTGCVASQVAVRWIAPASARDRALLDEACRSVGQPLVVNSESRGAQPVDRLVVVSWNAHAGLADLNAMTGALLQGRLTGGRPPGSFVLLLQEAARDADAAGDAGGVDRVARDRGLSLAYAPGMNNGGPGRDRGVAILSSSPLTDVTIVELPFERQRRVALLATLRLPTGGTERTMRVASAHLDIGWMVLRGGSEAARRRQAEALIEAIGPDGTVVLGGDFNSAYEDAEGALRTLASAYSDADAPAPPTWQGPFGLHRHLDRIFVRGGGRPIRVSVVPDRFGSDHHPLIAELPLE